MDPLDSYRISLRNLLGAALREHRYTRIWYYAIDMEETNQDSLASYLGIKHEKLRSLLLASGLACLYGKQFRLNQKQRQSGYNWGQFLVDQRLEGCYLDKFEIKKKNYPWIGLGSKEVSKASLKNNSREIALPSTPGTQSTYYKTPARLLECNHATLQKNGSMMLSLLDVYNEEIEKTKQQDAEEGKDDLDASSDRTNHEDEQEDMDTNVRASALVLLQQISKDEITDPVKALEDLLKTSRGLENSKQRARLSMVSGFENNQMEEEEFETSESSFPTLSKIGVPITKSLVSYLLREVH
jgi:hypothetical protein